MRIRDGWNETRALASPLASDYGVSLSSITAMPRKRWSRTIAEMVVSAWASAMSESCAIRDAT
jgi:hypothetical protein